MASDEPGLARIRRIRPRPRERQDDFITCVIGYILRGRLHIGEGIGQNLNPGRRSPLPLAVPLLVQRHIQQRTMCLVTL